MKYKKNLQDIKRNLSQKRLSRELQRNIGIINKNLRKLEMNKHKYIVNEYLNDFINWMKLREITYYIKKIRNTEEVIIKERSKSFEHKCKNKEDIMLANKLIKSTADYYVNKAISVLKEEKLKGREEECLEILQKIFMET